MNDAGRDAPRRRKARLPWAIAIAVLSTAPSLLGCDVLLGITDVPVPETDGGTNVHPAGPMDGSADADAQASSPPTTTGACDTASDTHNCGRCGHDCLGGQCLGGVCQAVALLDIDAGASPRDLAQDDSFLYWTDLSKGTVNRTSKTTGVTMLAYRDPSPVGIAVDDAGIYWGDFQGLWRCPKAACNPSATPTLVAHATTGVFSLAIDDQSIYWSEESARVFAAPKDGADAGGATVWKGSTSVNYLATDGQRLYFTADDGMLHIAGVDGGQPTAIGTAGPSSSEGVALEDGVVYWTVFDPSNGQVNAASTTSLTPTTFVGTLELPLPVASDGINVYWADMPSEGPPTAEIHKCAVAACSPIVIGHGYLPHAIVVDDVAVYWTDTQSTTGLYGSLWKIAK